jgi:hypothetical protein
VNTRTRAAALAASLAIVCALPISAAEPDSPKRAGRLEDCAPARSATMLHDRVVFWARDGAPVALAAELTSDVAGEETRAVPWRLVVTTLDRRVVDERSGVVHLSDGRALAAVSFDGRDAAGRPLPPGTYVYRFEAHGFEGSGAFLRVYATDETPDTSEDALAPLAASLNPSVPYSFYFGSQHAHTNYSDGGNPLSTCTGSVSSPHAGASPTDAFAYAKANGNVDWICVLEHNHLIDDACGSCAAATIQGRYHDGLNAAAAATTPAFVGIYGMEWGVISNGGHVALYDVTKLMSWESYAEVSTPEYDYGALWTTANNTAYQGASGAAGAFCHPKTTDFGTFTQNAAGLALLHGLAVVSGPYNQLGTSFADAGGRYAGPKATTDIYQYALQRGWKIGPEAHGDQHCWNYGNSTRNRTVILANGLTKATVMDAIQKRRFYASSDLNAQMFFGTADYAHVMGDIYTTTSVTQSLLVWINDPDGSPVSTVTLYDGDANSAGGTPSTVTMTSAGSGTYTATVNVPATGQHYYYVYATLGNGAELWSAPVWISRSAGCTDTTAPAATVTAPTSSSVSGTVTVSATATDSVGVTGMTLKIDGAQVATSTSGSVGYSWNTSGLAAGSSHSIVATASDACGNVGTSATKTVTIGSGAVFVDPTGNPGFEAGVPPTPWTESGTYEQVQTGSAAAIDGATVPVHAGAKMAWMAGYDNATDVLKQNVAIPNVAGDLNLKFYRQVHTTDGTGTAYDFLYVEVWNSAGTSKLATLTTLSNRNAGSTWIRTTAGLLNTWKGQTVQIRFTATNDTSNPTDFFVDDVAITNP